MSQLPCHVIEQKVKTKQLHYPHFKPSGGSVRMHETNGECFKSRRVQSVRERNGKHVVRCEIADIELVCTPSVFQGMKICVFVVLQ